MAQQWVETQLEYRHRSWYCRPHWTTLSHQSWGKRQNWRYHQTVGGWRRNPPQVHHCSQWWLLQTTLGLHIDMCTQHRTEIHQWWQWLEKCWTAKVIDQACSYKHNFHAEYTIHGSLNYTNSELDIFLWNWTKLRVIVVYSTSKRHLCRNALGWLINIDCSSFHSPIILHA